MKTVLSDKGMVEIFGTKYYQLQVWEPKAGDYYAIGRGGDIGHHLCQIVEWGEVIETIQVDQPENVSSWTPSEFASFQDHRLHVQDYIFDYPEFWAD